MTDIGLSCHTDQSYDLGMRWGRASVANGGAVAASALVLYGIWDAAWFAGNPGSHRSWAWPTWWLLLPVAILGLSLLAIAFPILPHRAGPGNAKRERSSASAPQPRTRDQQPSHSQVPARLTGEDSDSPPNMPTANSASTTAAHELRVSNDLIDRRNELIEHLARCITSPLYIEQVAGEAGLDMAHLRLEGTPSNRWSDIIRRAEAEGKERAALVRVHHISQERGLHQAIQAYLRCRA
jgi:hypothetical protein